MGTCLKNFVNFSFARDASVIIPIILYARLLMRVASRRKSIRLAEERLKRVTSISKSEKARTMGTLKLHRRIIAEVYEPLRLYPVVFILILIADIAIYANLKKDSTETDEGAAKFAILMPVSQIIWIVFNGVGITIIFFSSKDNRDKLSWSQISSRLSRSRKSVRIADSVPHLHRYSRLESSAADDADDDDGADPLAYYEFAEEDEGDAEEEESTFKKNLRKRGTISGKLLGRAPPTIEDESDEEDEESIIGVSSADGDASSPPQPPSAGYVPPVLPPPAEDGASS